MTAEEAGFRGRRRLALTAAALGLGLVAIALAFGGGRSPGELVPLELKERDLVEVSNGERLYSLRFDTPGGRSISAFLREPAAAHDTILSLHGGIVLAAGRYAGRQAAAVIPGPLEQVVLAVEYPEEIPDRITVIRWIRGLPAFARAAREMPGVLRGAGHFMAANPAVDPTDITLVGVSFGVPFAAAAGHDRIFTGVALHFGGADIAGMLRANLPIRNDFVRSGFAGFGAWIFRDLEPARHVGRISPTPLLLINGTDDDQIPHTSAQLLANHAGPPVRHIWLKHGHLSTRDTHLLRELADSTYLHFRQLRTTGGPPAGASPHAHPPFTPVRLLLTGAVPGAEETTEPALTEP